MSQVQERQRMATTDGDDADVYGYHHENGMLAVNLFHMRGGKIVDRREFFWEELPEYPPELNASEHPLPESDSRRTRNNCLGTPEQRVSRNRTAPPLTPPSFSPPC